MLEEKQTCEFIQVQRAWHFDPRRYFSWTNWQTRRNKLVSQAKCLPHSLYRGIIYAYISKAYSGALLYILTRIVPHLNPLNTCLSDCVYSIVLFWKRKPLFPSLPSPAPSPPLPQVVYSYSLWSLLYLQTSGIAYTLYLLCVVYSIYHHLTVLPLCTHAAWQNYRFMKIYFFTDIYNCKYCLFVMDYIGWSGVPETAISSSSSILSTVPAVQTLTKTSLADVDHIFFFNNASS